MDTTEIQTETQRGKHRPSMVLFAAVSAALLAVAVAADRGSSSGDVETSPRAPVTTTAPMPTEELVVRAAEKAALVQLCVDGLGDPEAAAEYQRARAAHPDMAEGIGPDCQLLSGRERVPAGRAGIAMR